MKSLKPVSGRYVCLLTLISFLLLTGCGKETGKYFNKTIDFKDSINSKYFHGNVEFPGVLLVRGYLMGKLPGYEAPYNTEVLKRAPYQGPMPPMWEPGVDYYEGEEVIFNGKAYACRMDGAKGNPAGSEYWEMFELLGDIVSERNYYPGLPDTLSKNEFLEKLVSDWGQTYPEWSPMMDYYQADRVSFNGNAYESMEDNRGKNPLESRDSWAQIRTGPSFYFGNDLSVVQILYTEKSGLFGIELVQSRLTVMTFDYRLEFLRPVVSFDYSEAMTYLNSLDQPVALKSELGNTGSDILLLDEVSKLELMKQIRDNLLRKTLTIPDEQILQKDLLEKFTHDPLDGTGLFWDVFQEPKSGKVIVTGLDKNFIVRVAELETGLLKKSLPAMGNSNEPSPVADWDRYNFLMDTAYVDSLPPAGEVVKCRTVKKPLVFYESYGASIDESLSGEFLSAWKAIDRLYDEKKIGLSAPVRSFYPWEYRWKNVDVGNWKYSELSFLDRVDNPDTLRTPVRIPSVRITFARSPGSAEIVPVDIMFQIEFPVEDGSGFEEYTFKYADLKSQLNSKPEGMKVLARVETADLPFISSWIAYGLKEGK